MNYQLNKEFLKSILKERKVTYAKLAEALTYYGQDISESGIKFWFKSEKNKPEIEKVRAMADILEVSFESLAIIEPELKNEILGQYADVKFVPIVGETSCGLPISSSYQENNRKTYYHGDFWHEKLYAVVACGDSMATDIEDGDEIVCDPTADILDGDIVHYEFMGESAVKIYHDNRALNAIELIPYNQSPEFKTKAIRRDDENFGELKMSKVVSINKLRLNNRKARLRAVGRG